MQVVQITLGASLWHFPQSWRFSTSDNRVFQALNFVEKSFYFVVLLFQSVVYRIYMCGCRGCQLLKL